MKNVQINFKFQILLALLVGASASFLSTPSNQFQPSFLAKNDRLLKPIIIPNLTPDVNDTKPLKNKDGSSDFYKKFHPERKEEPSKEPAPQETYSEESKLGENSLKFSSRYSSKSDLDEVITKDVRGRLDKEEKRGESVQNATAEEIPSDRKFSDRSDTSFPYEEDEEDEDTVHRHSDSSEPKDAEETEESEVGPTTSEPYSELRRPYLDEDFENYETSSAISEESEDSEEKEEPEEKRSVEDYHDSGSKNYHSVQTPLREIQYRGPHTFKDDFDSGKTRTRLISPMRRRPAGHHWPYSKAHLKAEQFNEIPGEEEWKAEEPKANPKILELELAVERDEANFGQSVKEPYNYIEEKNRKKQRQNELAAVEEKDHKSPFFQSLKHYKVDEEPIATPKIQFVEKPKPKLKIWSNSNQQKAKQPVAATKFNITKELSPNFQQFLGPVVFSQNTEHHRVKPTAKPNHKATQALRNIFLKDLEEKERLDQENLTNQRFQKAVPPSGKLKNQSFNHLEESDEMYNQILANIQSVFGIRTQPLKSATGRKSGLRELDLEENRALTWSVPLVRREKASPPENGAARNQTGALSP